MALNVVLRQLRHGGSSNPKICPEVLDAITDTDLAVIHWMHYLPRIMDQLQLAQHGIKCAMLKLLLRLLHTGHIKMCAENGTVIALLLEEIPFLVLEELPYPVHIPGIMTNVITCIADVCTGGIISSVEVFDWLRVVVCAHVDIYADVQHTCGPDEKLVAYGMTYVSVLCFTTGHENTHSICSDQVHSAHTHHKMHLIVDAWVHNICDRLSRVCAQ